MFNKIKARKEIEVRIAPKPNTKFIPFYSAILGVIKSFKTVANRTKLKFIALNFNIYIFTFANDSSFPANQFTRMMLLVILIDSPPSPKINLPRIISLKLSIRLPMYRTV